jgi:hypothetical protein
LNINPHGPMSGATVRDLSACLGFLVEPPAIECCPGILREFVPLEIGSSLEKQPSERRDLVEIEIDMDGTAMPAPIGQIRGLHRAAIRRRDGSDAVPLQPGRIASNTLPPLEFRSKDRARKVMA